MRKVGRGGGGLLSASGPIRIVGGGVEVLSASRLAIEDMNSNLR